MAYDPFSQRKKIPDFPSVFSVNGWTGAEKPVAPRTYQTPYGQVGSSSEVASPPPLPPDSTAMQNQPVPPMPDAGAPDNPEVPLSPLDAGGQDGQQQPQQPDMHPDISHANDIIGQFDDIARMIDSIGQPQDAVPSGDVDHPYPHTESIGPGTPDRSWMFRGSAGMGSNTPAPVTFNHTASGDWGTGAVQFNDTQSDDWGSTTQGATYQPRAASTQRFYDRAELRGSRADQQRLRHLNLRTRPGARMAG